MTDPAPSHQLLIKLTVVSNPRMVPAVCALVREVAMQHGFNEEDARRLELVTEEAAMVVIEHSFQGRTDGFYDLTIENRPAQFLIALEDAGLPFDWAKAGDSETSGLSMRLIRGLADEVRFINQGRKGKRIELIRNYSDLSLRSTADDEPGIGTGAPPVSDAPVTLRPMNAEDGVALSRCMYTVYGYTYKELVYFPDKVREMVEAGLLISTVAVTADGDIVAHQGLRKEQPDSKVAEITMGAVDPRFRGRGLFEKLKETAFAAIRGTGVYGLYGEAVTLHPYSQKANIAMGARETGILFGYIPADRTFKSLDQQPERGSVVVFYTPLNPAPQRTVYPPTSSIELMRRIYDWCGIGRTLAIPGSDEPAAWPEHCEIDVLAYPDSGTAVIRVMAFGADIVNAIRFRQRELCLSHFSCIYIDLPLSSPGTSQFAPEFQKLGFFFGAVFPELREGDILRLQYLNNVAIDIKRIVLVTEFGRKLLSELGREL